MNHSLEIIEAAQNIEPLDPVLDMLIAKNTDGSETQALLPFQPASEQRGFSTGTHQNHSLLPCSLEHFFAYDAWQVAIRQEQGEIEHRDKAEKKQPRNAFVLRS